MFTKKRKNKKGNGYGQHTDNRNGNRQGEKPADGRSNGEQRPNGRFNDRQRSNHHNGNRPGNGFTQQRAVGERPKNGDNRPQANNRQPKHDKAGQPKPGTPMAAAVQKTGNDAPRKPEQMQPNERQGE